MEKGIVKESSILLQGTLLNDQYVIQDIISRDYLETRYLVEDYLSHRKRVICELFPRAYMTRLYGSETPIFYNHESETAFQQLKTDYQIETKRLQQLKGCENVEQVVDSFEEYGTIYRILDYYEGESLNDLLDKKNKLSPEEAKKIFIGITRGIYQIHQTGIIHGNLSPDTIWITVDKRVMLQSLGSVRHIYSFYTKKMKDVFSYGYVAYERYGDISTQGAWTDIYSLGAIYYRMITGYVPPDSMERSLQDTLIKPSELGIELPQGEENAFMKCLSIQAVDRYHSIEEVMQIFHITKEDFTQMRPLERFKSRKRIYWKKIVIFLLVLLLVSAGGSLTARRFIGNSSDKETVQETKEKTEKKAEKKTRNKTGK